MTTMLRKASSAIYAAAALAAMSLPSHASDVAGRWIMTDGKVTVQVSACGSNICGKIVALKELISKIDGKPKIDRENPDPALRSRPVIGLDILIGMKPAGDGKWAGAIYNADDGKTYKATIQQSGDKIKLQACVAIFCKTQNFVRAN